MKTLLVLLAVMLGLAFSAQAATSTSAVSVQRVQDLSHRYYHHHHYYHHRRVYYRHGYRYYRYY